MNKIHSLQVDLSDMPTEAITRSFTIRGDRDSEFILYVVQDGTIKYYDWVDGSFELGHNDKNNNLKITLGGNDHNGISSFTRH